MSALRAHGVVIIRWVHDRDVLGKRGPLMQLALDRTDTSSLTRIFEAAIIVAALATVPLTIAQQQDVTHWWVVTADWSVWGIFLAEYLFLMAVSTDRRQTARDQWLSSAIIVLSFPFLPALFALSRLARLMRLFRLLRLVLVATRGLKAIRYVFGRHEVVYLAGVAGFLILVAGGILSIVEPEHGDFWAGIWWAVVTTTTVGYGDIAPVTTIGRITAVVLMFVGIGLVATLAAGMASYFVGDSASDDTAEIKARLERMEAMLADLSRGQNTGGS